MAFEINRNSIVQSFILDTLAGESLQIYLYGCNYNGSTHLANPSAALAEINNAFNTVKYLDYKAVMIQASLNDLGSAMVFALDEARYRDSKYLNPEYVVTLRTAIQNALNNLAPNLVYNDVVIGTSQVDKDYA